MAVTIKTLPEILVQMFATTRTQLGDDADLNIGSMLRTTLEAAALQDADQFVQIARLRLLFSILDAKGDDLDRRALEIGAFLFADLRRLPARPSISEVEIGDGTNTASSTLDGDVAIGSTTFDLVDGSAFPAAGSMVLSRGTNREEEIYYTRIGDTITVVTPTTGTAKAHAQGDSALEKSTRSPIAALVAIGAGACTLVSGTETAWPASGTIIFERDTVRRESFTFTRVGTAVTLTSGVTAFQHDAGTDVILSTAGSDRAIAVGTTISVPATLASQQIDFVTTEAGTLLDGDLVSDLIDVQSTDAGAETLAGANTITQFSTAPFVGATSRNPTAAVQGRDRERDDEYRQRLVDFIQSLSNATKKAVETKVAGKTDPESGKVIAFAQAVEPVSLTDEALLYVTDGSTTFSMETAKKSGREVLISDAEVGDARAKLGESAPYSLVATPAASRTPRIWKSLDRGVATSVGANYLEDSGAAWTVNAYTGFYVKTDDDQFYLITSNTAIRLTLSAGGATPSLGSYSIFDFTSDPLEPGVDYTFARSTGDLELVTALVEHDGLVAADDGATALGAYIYAINLAAFAQKLVNGDPDDFTNYPGIKALGEQVRVLAPTIVSPFFTIQVITQTGFADTDLADTINAAVQAYVNSLGIGANVILSEIIRIVKGLPGVRDVRILSPTSNVTVAEGQLARITDANVSIV